MMNIRQYRHSDENDVIELWRDVFPSAPARNDPSKDIALKLTEQPELFLVAVVDGLLVGTAMAGFDGHRGWVYYVAVHSAYRRQVIGSALMSEVEAALAHHGCPKLNLQIRSSNAEVQAFYESIGYITEGRISMGKKLDPKMGKSGS